MSPDIEKPQHSPNEDDSLEKCDSLDSLTLVVEVSTSIVQEGNTSQQDAQE